MGWRDSFIKTKQFKELFNEDENEVIIYYGDWGHKKPAHKDSGCWSRVCLDKLGRLTYQAGYKWMGTQIEFDFRQGATIQLSYNYLNKLHKHIRDGSVYKTIIRKLKEREL